MDELLLERVKQLREIDQRLEDVMRHYRTSSWRELQQLRDDLRRWIAVAEAEYEDF